MKQDNNKPSFIKYCLFHRRTYPDGNATTPSANAYTPAQVLAFMQRLLPKLEQLDFVKRYSWFSGDPKGAQLWPSALIDANGNLTALGSWYANYQPNAAIAK